MITLVSFKCYSLVVGMLFACCWSGFCACVWCLSVFFSRCFLQGERGGGIFLIFSCTGGIKLGQKNSMNITGQNGSTTETIQNSIIL